MASISRWPVFAPVVAISLLVCGLVLNAATISYDLTHLDAASYVPPDVAANRNGLADLALVHSYQVGLVVSGLAVAGLLLSMVGLVRGRRWAPVTASVLAAPFVLCFGPEFINGMGSFAGTVDDPNTIGPRHTAAPAWVLICDRLGPPLLVGAAIVVLILMMLPPVRRRCHPHPHRRDPQ